MDTSDVPPSQSKPKGGPQNRRPQQPKKRSPNEPGQAPSQDPSSSTMNDHAQSRSQGQPARQQGAQGGRNPARSAKATSAASSSPSDRANGSRGAAPPAASPSPQESGDRPQPSPPVAQNSFSPSSDASSTASLSQSQKRKERRRNTAAKYRQQSDSASASGTDDAQGTSTPISASPAPSNSSGSTPASETRAPAQRPSNRSGGGGNYHPDVAMARDGNSQGGGRSKQRNEAQLLKEEVAAARAAPKLKNLSGFGQDDDYYASSSVTSSKAQKREALTSSAEYVPSTQRDSRRANANLPKIHEPSAAKGKFDIQLATEGQTELASKIIRELVSNGYECAICFANIRPAVATWSCNHCFSIFHIVCAKKWAKSIRDPNAPADAPIGRWHCPKCRHGHEGSPAALCFCGKVKNPAYDPMKVPHSCGEPCLKPRSGTTCPHTCPLQCHPGPCPPCASMGPVKQCWCGRATYRLRCGQHDEGQSCGHPCEKPLNCRRHKCAVACHTGPCAPCAHQVEQTCYCGKTVATRTCGAPDEKEDDSTGEARFFSCQTACGRTLDCGNHQCTRICHTGPCDPCHLKPAQVTTCGCGARPILEVNGKPRESCLDPIPSCGGVCGKTRACGHKCQQKCHPGACEPCQVDVEVPCRCHTQSKPMKCADVFPNLAALTAGFTCLRSCGRIKSCGKHHCTTKCCPSIWDKSDSEGYHVCRETCNKPLACKVHRCKQPCHKGRCDRCLEANFNDVVCACGKTVQEAPIPCGTAPLVCPHPCTKVRPCGHPTSSHTCHDGPCPPCLVPMQLPCIGGHTVMLNIPCFRRDISCGVACNKPMVCGLHNCKRLCHGGACEPPMPEDAELLPGQKPSCGQTCGLSLYTCEHRCVAPCHPGVPCPTTECTQMTRVTCECGVVSSEIQCPGKEKPVLPCTSACESAKRQKRLAEAFGIMGSSTSAPRYPDLLINMACVAPLFITRLEKWLDDFVKTPSHITRQDLPPLDRVQRQCVHELAKFYGIGTESSGSEDRYTRAVTLTKRRDCKPPIVSLTKVSGLAGLHDPTKPVDSGSNLTLLLDSSPSSTLHIYDLHKGIYTSTIHAFLNAFPNEYTLQWVDDETCLAIFSDPARMQRALNTLQPRGTFKVKPYQDVIPEPLSTGLVSLGTTSVWKAPEAAPTADVRPKVKIDSSEGNYKPQSVWNRGNPFSVLESPSQGATVNQGSLMMWNLGEKSDSGQDSSSSPAPSTSAAQETVTERKEPVPAVEDWEQLVDDEQKPEETQ